MSAVTRVNSQRVRRSSIPTISTPGARLLQEQEQGRRNPVMGQQSIVLQNINAPPHVPAIRVEINRDARYAPIKDVVCRQTHGEDYMETTVRVAYDRQPHPQQSQAHRSRDSHHRSHHGADHHSAAALVTQNSPVLVYPTAPASHASTALVHSSAPTANANAIAHRTATRDHAAHGTTHRAAHAAPPAQQNTSRRHDHHREPAAARSEQRTPHREYDLDEQEAIYSSIQESARLEGELRRQRQGITGLDLLRGPSGEILSPIPPSQVENFIEHRRRGDRVLSPSERSQRSRQSGESAESGRSGGSASGTRHGTRHRHGPIIQDSTPSPPLIVAQLPETSSDQCIAHLLHKIDLEEREAERRYEEIAREHQRNLDRLDGHEQARNRETDRETERKRDAMRRAGTTVDGRSSRSGSGSGTNSNSNSSGSSTAHASGSRSARSSHTPAQPPSHTPQLAPAAQLTPARSAGGRSDRSDQSGRSGRSDQSDRTVRPPSHTQARPRAAQSDGWGNDSHYDSHPRNDTPAVQNITPPQPASPASTAMRPLSRYSDRPWVPAPPRAETNACPFSKQQGG